MKNWLIKIYVGIGFIMFLLCNPCSSGGAVNPVEIIKVAFKSAIWPYILYEEFRGDDAIPQITIFDQYVVKLPEKNNKGNDTVSEISNDEGNLSLVPKSCSKFKADQELTLICEVSRKVNVNMDKTVIGVFIASLKTTSKLCNFGLTEISKKGINQGLKDQDILKVYEYLVKNADYDIPLKEDYCNIQYEMKSSNGEQLFILKD